METVSAADCLYFLVRHPHQLPWNDFMFSNTIIAYIIVLKTTDTRTKYTFIFSKQ